MTVYDYSSARPDPAELGDGVMRYLCDGAQSGKQLQLPEAQALWAAGKRVGLVWENRATDSDSAYDGGHRNGTEARRQARALGFPDTVPIYCAVDRRLTDSQRVVAVDYFHGFADGCGAARPYGEAAFVDACVAAGYTDCGWTPSTWGHSSNLALIQLVTASPVSGTDANQIVRGDWGGWHPNDTPQPPPPSEDDEMNLSIATCTQMIEQTYHWYGQDGDVKGKIGWQQGCAAVPPDQRDGVLTRMVQQLAAAHGM